MEMVVLSSLCWDLYTEAAEDVPLVGQFSNTLNITSPSSHL
jgi:hypothetical protein